MPFPTTGILDDFNRADGGIGANYNVPAGGFNVASNVAAPTSGTSVAIWNVSTYGPNFEAYVDITTKPGDGFSITVGQINGTTFNGHYAFLDAAAGTDNIGIARLDAGVPTVLGAFIAQEWSAGDALGYCQNGTTHEVWVRLSGTWSLAGSRTDATYTGVTTNTLALITTDGTVRFDNFGGGNIVASTGARALWMPVLGVA